ncbi:IclR family transcriptional regulator [Mangrovicoccus algicola]|uniref:IclR family transcriptional regulator n=1 Tax=Mangrovicoccus algicola TaxID=2771008 RepID=A0A8J6Z208_9RHOB|nr:IclR family transcriptional regulator [Mangrovicoccus algicola]MBE3640161.1 IclR family transcriptional regulator [Mangrovicoccus algicola]
MEEDHGSRAAGPAKGTQTLMRGLEAVRLVSEGVSDAAGIGRALGVPRSTVHRLLSSLVAAGYLHHLPQGGYLLGPQLISLGERARQQRPVQALAAPVLRRLADLTGDTVHLGVPDGAEVLYLDKIEGTRGLEMRSRPGHRMPLALTGLGKAMMLAMPEPRWEPLWRAAAEIQKSHPGRVPPRPWPEFRADLLEARQRGYCFDLEENEYGIRCAGAPVRDATGQVVAGLSVASAVPFMPESRLAELGPVVAAHAAEISRILGGSPE